MANFRYSAIRNDGARVSGAMEGGDRSTVLRRLSEQGLHPIDVESTEGTVAGLPPASGSLARGFGQAPPRRSGL